MDLICYILYNIIYDIYVYTLYRFQIHTRMFCYETRIQNKSASVKLKQVTCYVPINFSVTSWEEKQPSKCRELLSSALNVSLPLLADKRMLVALLQRRSALLHYIHVAVFIVLWTKLVQSHYCFALMQIIVQLRLKWDFLSVVCK